MGRKIPDVLTIDEENKLINIFNCRYYNSYKNKIIVTLFLNTGLRLSELIDLKWSNINLSTGQLKVVQGKGNKDRILWIPDDVLEQIKEYREKQFNKQGSCVYVFETSSNNKLDQKNVRDMIYKYSEKALNKKVSPHTLRHSYATDLLRATNNIRLVQKALGHSDISTTMIYTHIVDEDLEKALKNFRG